MRKTYLILILIISAIHLIGLTPAEVKAQPEIYVWGEGRGNSQKQASDAALKNLVRQIFISVNARFTSTTIEDDGKVGEYDESVLEAWVPTLDLMGAPFIELDGGRRVFCYIERSKLDQMWADRRRKITDFVSLGQAAEENYTIDSALKNYYWALVLLRIHPHESSITYLWNDEERLLKPVLTNRIDELLKGLSGQVTHLESIDGLTEIEMKFFWHNHPVSSLAYSYNNGCSTVQQTARNGTAILCIPDDCLKIMRNVPLKVEYTFSTEAKHDKGLYSALDDPGIPWFPNNTFEVPLHKQPLTCTNMLNPIPQNKFNATSDVKILDPSETSEWSKKIEQVVSAIEQKDPELARERFTNKGFTDFETIVGYGNCKLAHAQAPIQYIDVDGCVTARSVECLFDFQHSTSSFTDKLNFQFNKNGLIDEVSFALGDQALEDLFKDENLKDCELDKIRIAQFLETYKTGVLPEGYQLREAGLCRQCLDHRGTCLEGYGSRPER